MHINRSLRLTPSEFLAGPVRKNLIILHHTAGATAKSTFTWWQTDPKRIGTAYIVERDGTVFEVFPPDAWAFHLGLEGPQGKVDKRSIGIEIACEGGLLFRGGRHYAFDRLTPGNQFRGNVYDHGEPWRSYQHYAAYTTAQVDAVIQLVQTLAADFGIPLQTPRSHYAADLARWRDYTGILSHSHLRPDKTDVHPGFPWGRLIEECGLNQAG